MAPSVETISPENDIFSKIFQFFVYRYGIPDYLAVTNCDKIHVDRKSRELLEKGCYFLHSVIWNCNIIEKKIVT